MQLESLLSLFVSNQKLHRIEGRMDPSPIYETLNVDEAGLTFFFCRLFVIFFRDLQRHKDKICELEKENDILKEAIDSTIKNGRERQAALVRCGLPIAKKQRKNLFILDGDIKLGYTDEEIMRLHGISRTTLWRWKKELQELKKQKRSLF